MSATDSIFPEFLVSEKFPDIVITDPATCFYCGSAPVKPSDTYCPACSFPQNGPTIEQHAFIEKAREKAARHLKLEQIIGWSQTVLLFVGLTALVVGIGFFLMYDDAGIHMLSEKMTPAIIYTVTAALPYLALWQWSKKHPFPAILTALVLEILAVVASVFTHSSLLSLTLPLLFVLVFTHGLISYKEAVAIEKELLVPARRLE